MLYMYTHNPTHHYSFRLPHHSTHPSHGTFMLLPALGVDEPRGDRQKCVVAAQCIVIIHPSQPARQHDE